MNIFSYIGAFGLGVIVTVIGVELCVLLRSYQLFIKAKTFVLLRETPLDSLPPSLRRL